jgi:hypothetical protein
MVEVCEWTRQLRLQINPTKSEFLMVGSRQLLPKCTTTHIDIDGDIVKRSDCIKLLGVPIDSHLTLRTFVNTKVSRAANSIRKIAAIRKYLTADSAQTIAAAMVNSHFDYCNTLLYNLPQCRLNRIQVTQNWAAKVVLKADKYSSATAARLKLHWLPIEARIQFKIATLVHKCLHQQAPQYLQDLVTIKTYNRPTRSSQNSSQLLEVPFTRRNTFKDRSFSVAGPKIWNSLPNHLRDIDDLLQFRKELKTVLFKKCY